MNAVVGIDGSYGGLAGSDHRDFPLTPLDEKTARAKPSPIQFATHVCVTKRQNDVIEKPNFC